MKNVIIKSLSGIVIAVMLVSCSAKNKDELYNLRASDWYDIIIKDLAKRDLEKADEHYMGFVSEHAIDKLLEPILLILTQRHIDEENYQMAVFYLDEYNKKFGSSKNVDYIRYLKIKAKYDSFIRPNRNQKLIYDTIDEIKGFLDQKPPKKYEILANTMLNRFYITSYYLDQSIYDLYQRIDKKDSAKIIEKRLKNSEFYGMDIVPPYTPWYRAIFEGSK